MKSVDLSFLCILTLMNTFNALIGDSPHNFIGKSLSREESPRKLQEKDNYISLKFYKEVTYDSGFNNQYRHDIKYIYNHYDGKTYTADECLNIKGAIPIDIHFTKPLTNMDNFFNRGWSKHDSDENLDYLIFADFSHFDASELVTINSGFEHCRHLESVNFENFNAPKLVEIMDLFNNCVGLKSLDFSTFNAPNLKDIGYLCYYCPNLKMLDLSNQNLLKVDKVENMLYGDNKIEYINLNNSLFSNVLIKKLQALSGYNLIVCQTSQIITGLNVRNLCCDFNVDSRKCSSGNYITIYYNQRCNYTNGFYNEYRKKVIFLHIGFTIENTSYFEITAGKKIEISLESDIETLEHFFDSRYDENMQYVESIDFSNFNSSLLRNCKNLFYGCTSLKSINLSNFDSSQVINMEGMFQGCNSLLSVYLSNFNTSKVTDTSFMFSNCTSLASLDLSNFDMTNIKNHKSMFEGNNQKLKYLKIYNINNPEIILDSDFNKINDLFVCQDREIISNINSHNVCCIYNLELDKCDITSYIELYYNKNITYKIGFKNSYRKSLSYIIYEDEMIYDIQEFNVSAGTKVELQFYYPPTDLESFFDVNYDENMHYIEKIDFFNFDSSSITNSKNMFNGCDSLKYANLSNFKPTTLNTAINMFKGCSSLIILDIANLNLSSIIEKEEIFDTHNNLRYINLYNTTDKNNMISESKLDKVKDLILCQHDDIILSSNSHNVCCNFDYETHECPKDDYIIIYYKERCNYNDGFKNEKRNNIHFIYYRNVTYSDKDKINLIDDSILEINFNFPIDSLESFFDSRYDKNMLKVESIDLTKFNLTTNNVNNMNNMFYKCSSLKSVYFSSFTPKKFLSMYQLFSGCSSLLSVDLSGFAIFKADDYSLMFEDCTSIKSIDITNFIFSNNLKKGDMFLNVNNLKYINLKNALGNTTLLLNSQLNKINNLIVCKDNSLTFVNNTSTKKICCNYNIETDLCESNNYIALYYIIMQMDLEINIKMK